MGVNEGVLFISVLDRRSICQILQLSVTSLNQWELRQRKGDRCSSKDMKKWRTLRLMVCIQLFTFHYSVLMLFTVLCIQHYSFYSKGNLAQCHYCTHYSSAIIVASFLVRMEPFSHTFQTLQVRPWTLIVGHLYDLKKNKLVFDQMWWLSSHSREVGKKNVHDLLAY